MKRADSLTLLVQCFKQNYIQGLLLLYNQLSPHCYSEVGYAQNRFIKLIRKCASLKEDFSRRNSTIYFFDPKQICTPEVVIILIVILIPPISLILIVIIPKKNEI